MRHDGILRVRWVAPIVAAVWLAAAAALPAPAAAAPAGTAIHRVAPGDTLWNLSRRYGTTPEALARLNGIPVDGILSLGQALKVPGSARAPSSAAAAVRPRPAASYTYRVQPGDTLWRISRRYGTTPERLASANGFSPEATLQIGQALKVPAPAGSAAPAAARPAPAAPSAALRARLAALPARGEHWYSEMDGLARRQMGVRYRWGGTTPSGFDCSGFLYYVFGRLGVDLPRTTYEMFRTGAPVPDGEMQAGDLVFFQTIAPGPSHAGIYLGEGRFIHSSSGFGRVTITPLDHRYYAPRYLGARRF